VWPTLRCSVSRSRRQRRQPDISAQPQPASSLAAAQLLLPRCRQLAADLDGSSTSVEPAPQHEGWRRAVVQNVCWWLCLRLQRHIVQLRPASQEWRSRSVRGHERSAAVMQSAGRQIVSGRLCNVCGTNPSHTAGAVHHNAPVVPKAHIGSQRQHGVAIKGTTIPGTRYRGHPASNKIHHRQCDSLQTLTTV
jgi:hypothetical protein